MSHYVLPCVLGLLTGLLLHWAGFSRQEGLHRALGLRRSIPLRSGLTAAGWSMALTALLCWLAVIDVDTIEVLPLSAGALAGGAVLGIAAGLCGFTPSTAFAGLGAGRTLEALCILAGCGLTSRLMPHLTGWLSALQQSAPYSAATLFKVTLDEPFVLGGGFAGQACAGFLLITAAICIPSPKAGMQPAEDAPVPPSAAEEPDGSDSIPAPEKAPEDTFVALLPGEEPLVVDTELDESTGSDSPPSDAAESSAEEDDPQQDAPDEEKQSQDP